ncbi:response regulator [Zooshikella marina]|uniref:response regulator n=1 Tax=Zooshikella ganghwensis TaxID=202772 RepID=UPI001BB0CECE|nr:response regulator [Zooshikella ganghwensis]MBU2708197.1 response regulator [Zooshikella ganghwensis]
MSFYLALGLSFAVGILVIILSQRMVRQLKSLLDFVNTSHIVSDDIKPLLTRNDIVGQVASRFIRLTQQLHDQEWLRVGQEQLARDLIGDLVPRDLAYATLRSISIHLNTELGAFYRVLKNGDLELLNGYALTGVVNAKRHIPRGDTILASAIEKSKVFVKTDLPSDYFNVHSGLGNGLPKSLAIIPIKYEGNVIAVIEIAGSEFTDLHQQFLQRIADSIGLALTAADSRNNTVKLLEETQKQQQELRLINEQLKDQSAQLESSQDELKHQHVKLEQMNKALEQKTSELETTNQEILKQTEEITLQKAKLEEKAEQLERASQYKSEFLANMSHELRTPLNSLLLLARALKNNDAGNLSEEEVEDASIVYESGMELLELINGILDLSRIEAGKMNILKQPVDIKTIAEKLYRQLSAISTEKGLEFILDIDAKLPQQIVTDGHRLEQILKNLLANAFKFTTKGSVTLRLQKQGSTAVFSVQDTGIGISKDKQELIFNSFQQEDGSVDRKYGGTGLGLSIVKQLSSLLGGSVSLYSEKGKGSTFSVRLPLETIAQSSSHLETQKAIDNTNTESSETSQTLPTGGLGKYLMIVEDDQYFADTLVKLARQKGFHIVHETTGKRALITALSEPPIAIILDITLPDINGFQVLKQLKENKKTHHIPVHIVSGSDADENKLIQQGAVDYYSKPVTTEQLDELLASVANIQQSTLQRILVIEDNADNQQAIYKLLRSEAHDIVLTKYGLEALDKVQNESFDCVILDLQLPDISGFEWLKLAEKQCDTSLPPIIVYTARELTREETGWLEEYTGSIIIKGDHSPERLLDEVSLFLHSVESSLDVSQQRIVSMHCDESTTLQGRKIMIVDDDLRNVFALSKQLKHYGIEVVAADNGELALQKLDSEAGIELVVMDIMMPIMDGYEAIKHIRASALHNDLPIIVLTARSMPDEQRRCLDAGANDYLTKPVNLDILLTLFRVLLFEQQEA